MPAKASDIHRKSTLTKTRTQRIAEWQQTSLLGNFLIRINARIRPDYFISCSTDPPPGESPKNKQKIYFLYAARPSYSEKRRKRILKIFFVFILPVASNFQ